jgi:hydroxymethylpyrimidine/phosphomethylpyrimidine kinase
MDMLSGAISKNSLYCKTGWHCQIRLSFMSSTYPPPVVLTISGNDPTGGAGIAADIESIAVSGGQPAPVISTLTVQDSHNVTALYPVDQKTVLGQAEAILNDCNVKAIKTGLLGSIENIGAVHLIAKRYPEIPLVVDPILRAGGGKSLSDQHLINAMKELLLPYTTVLTPNSEEARKLSGSQSLDDAASELLSTRCQNVLITGTHEEEEDVVNRLYQNNGKQSDFSWPRLPFSYHGSGCTIASAIAAFLAQDFSIEEACQKAQKFTWNTLNHGYQIGKGQHQPNRLYKFRQ